MMIEIHIAGYPLRVGNKCRQLCAWCGKPLFDMDLELVAIAPGSEPAEPFIPWPIGELIEIEGPRSSVRQHPDGIPLPPRCCAFHAVPLKVVGSGDTAR